VIFAWEVQVPRPESGPESFFYSEKRKAVRLFNEAAADIWWSRVSYGEDVKVELFKLGTDLSRKSLYLACLSGSPLLPSRRESVRTWTIAKGCPLVEDDQLLDEYIRGAKLDALSRKYGMARSTVHDRMMRARRKMR